MRSGSPKPAAAVMRGTIWIAMVVCVSSLYEDQVLSRLGLLLAAHSFRGRHAPRAPLLLVLLPCRMSGWRRADGTNPRQVGKNDFHMANIGDIKTAQFHPDTQRKRLYFSTVRARPTCVGCRCFCSPVPDGMGAAPCPGS
jgi:hypothetical protein